MLREEVIKALINSSYTLSCAESLTGGKFASTITSYPGVSKFFLGGVVSYANRIKNEVLHVSLEALNSFGAVSKETAFEMVLGVKKLYKSDIAISFTGNAGPSSMEGKEKGLVYIGIIYLNKLRVYEKHFAGSRIEIQNACIDFGLEKIYNFLQGNDTEMSIVSMEV